MGSRTHRPGASPAARTPLRLAMAGNQQEREDTNDGAENLVLALSHSAAPRQKIALDLAESARGGIDLARQCRQSGDLRSGGLRTVHDAPRDVFSGPGHMSRCDMSGSMLPGASSQREENTHALTIVWRMAVPSPPHSTPAHRLPPSTSSRCRTRTTHATHDRMPVI